MSQSRVVALQTTNLGKVSASYRLAVLATNPISYWRLGEASGTVAVDEMGANNGTYIGAPTLGVAGLLASDPDTAVAFAAASTQYVSIAGVALAAGDWTVYAIVHPTSYAGVVNGIFAGEPAGVSLEFVTGVLTVSCSGVSNAAGSTASTPTGATYHVAATYVLATHTLTYYVNGVAAGTSTYNPSWSATAKTAIIGLFDTFGDFPFDGTIDEPAIWNRALSAAEVAALYAAGTTAPSTAMTEPESYTLPTYVSVDITPQFWGGDMLKLVCNTGDPGTNTLAEGMFIWLPDEGNKIFWIEHVVTSRTTAARVGSTITASGRSLDGFLDTERIIVPTGAYDTVTTVAAESAIKHYVNACAGTTAVASRQIPNFATVTDAVQGATVTLDARYRTLGQTLRHIGFLTGIGWYTYLDITTGLIMFDVIVPTDRSASIILDFDLGTIDEWDDEQNLLQSHSVAYVGGQGYLAQRTIQIRYQAGEPTGLGRRESFVSAGDIASSDTAGLNARGDAFLAANAPTRVTKAQITPTGAFKPDVDFFLGDLVEMTDTDAGTTILDRITSWTKHIENSAAAPTYEVSVGKPFPKADPDEVVPGVAVSDTTVIQSLVAGLITAESITSNTITADKFAATLALVSKIIAGNAIASRIELDSAGFRAYDSSGNQTINIPTDGTASTFTGAIIAATLEATGQVTVDAGLSLSKTAVGTLQAGVLAPGSAPVLAAGWATPLQLATPTHNSDIIIAISNGHYDSAGGVSGSTAVYLALVHFYAGGGSPGNTWWAVEWNLSNGSVNQKTQLTGITMGPSWDPSTGGGIARLGTSWYTVTIDDSIAGSSRVNKFLRSSGAQTATATRASTFYNDITTDGSSLLYLLEGNGAVHTWTTTPAFSATKTLTGIIAGGSLESLEYDGTNWWIIQTDNTTFTTARAYKITNSTGAVIANTSFPVPPTIATHGGASLYWDGSNFHTSLAWVPTVPAIYLHTAWDWTTASAKYWVGVAWYDDAGTVHETAIGPRSSIVMDRRQQLTITTTAIPVGGADDPDTVRVYMLPNATAPAPGAFWLQVTDALSNRALTNYTGSGTHDGAGTAFPGGAGAILQSADSAGFILKGNGVIGFKGTSNPSTGVAGDRYFRDDLDAMVHYDVANNTWSGGAHQAFQSGDVVAAAASLADLTGMTVTVGQGTWFVTVICYITTTASGSSATIANFILLADGTQVGTQEGFWTPEAVGGTVGSGNATVAQTWLVTIAAGASGVLKVQGDKSNTNSTVTFRATHSSITAIPIH